MSDVSTAADSPVVEVLGVGMTPFSAHHNRHSARDLARWAAVAALADAGCTIDDVDEIVVGVESDHFNRQLTIGSVIATELAVGPRPVTRVEGGGATGALALRAGATMVRSGEATVVLVVGAEKNGAEVTVGLAQELFALSADADVEFPMGATFPALYALVLAAHSDRYGTTAEQMAAVTVKNMSHARRNPDAHRSGAVSVSDVLASPVVAEPLRALDCSVLSDGGAAVVLGRWRPDGRSSPAARDRIVLRSSAAASAPARLGDRVVDGPDALTRFDAKASAATAAYERAGVADPAREIDVAEVYDSFSGAEILAYEDLGFCGRGEGGPAVASGAFSLDGPGSGGASNPVVNPSGGLLARGAAAGATGLAQACEIVSQLRGEAGDRQVPGARRGITDTHAGVCSLNVVHVFERIGGHDDA